MIATVPIVAGIYGKFKYDDFRRQPAKQQFALENVNAAALYFPNTVTFDGTIEILDIKAIDPNLIETNASNDSNTAQPKTDNIEQKTTEASTTKKHLRSLSEKGIKWFNKMKDNAMQKIDETKKEYENKRNNKNSDDNDDNKEKITAFTDNIHLQRQHNIPSFFKPYIINDDDIDIDRLISSNMRFKYKWKECRVLIHEYCIYICLDDEWRYLSLYNDDLELIPLSINNNKNESYWYWTDKKNNYVMARCDGNTNHFMNGYIVCKTDIVCNAKDRTEHIRRLWIMHENMMKARNDTLNLDGNIAAIYHRNEFELNLKLLIRSETDIRSDFWGKFEDTEYCVMTECNAKFGTFTRKHHCYVCGKVICDKCGKNVFKNPINDLEQRACNDCFSVFYPKMKEDNNIFSIPFHDVLREYNECKENQFEWNERERSILKESALLCHWIYDAPKQAKLIEILGFKQHKLVLYGQQNQSVQYGIIESLTHQDTMYLVFRGSYDLMDWMTNFQTNPLKLQELGFRVHSGMYCSLQQHALDVFIDSLCKKMVIPSHKRLVICGHSLGGGYAVLSAIYILSKLDYFNEDNLLVITFGAPRVLEKGIDKTTKIGALLSAITINFINQFDVIPRIGEGMSLEYIKKLTEKSIDDSMKKVWGLKQVDTIFNLNIQQKIQNHLFERDDVKNLDKVQQEIYGAIGAYYLLMSKHKPAKVISFAKNKDVFVRQLEGICLLMTDPNKLLSLLPKRSGLFANHMLCDHFMNHYLTALYYMDK